MLSGGRGSTLSLGSLPGPFVLLGPGLRQHLPEFPLEWVLTSQPGLKDADNQPPAGLGGERRAEGLFQFRGARGERAPRQSTQHGCESAPQAEGQSWK